MTWKNADTADAFMNISFYLHGIGGGYTNKAFYSQNLRLLLWKKEKKKERGNNFTPNNEKSVNEYKRTILCMGYCPFIVACIQANWDSRICRILYAKFFLQAFQKYLGSLWKHLVFFPYNIQMGFQPWFQWSETKFAAIGGAY